ncbi:MAG TPA: ABC transporter substrate-binding protein [Symbiobacteriaceae bacterium]|nr:ABC transporter substrate-binding protein [Symbiobacteriaceae bacterium]
MVRRRIVAAILALVVFVVAGCARPKETEEKPTPGGTLTLGLLRAPAGSLRPGAGEERDSALVAQLMYSGLLRSGPMYELVCDLCTDFAVSEDRRTLTFHLRKDVQWHDGKPLTAADVVFTYQSILAPEYTGAQAGRLTALLGVQAMMDERDAIDRDVAAGKVSLAGGAARKSAAWKRWLDGPGHRAVAAVDANTVTFTADVAFAPLLTVMLLPIAPAHTREPVGTGPFKLAEFKQGEYVRLVRHDAYHLAKPYVDAIICRVVPPGQAAEMLKAGTLDYAPLSPAQAAGVAAPVKVAEWPVFGYQYLGLNQDRPLFADRRVRQALLYGLNRQGLVDSVLQGRGTVLNTHMLPGHWAAQVSGLNAYPYDPAKAAALLTEAGWGALDGEGYRVRDGRRLQFTLKYPKGNPAREASAAQIQRDLSAIGVKVDLAVLEFGQLVREVFGERQADAWLLGWDVGIDPDPGPMFSPDNKWGQASGWSSRQSDELLSRGRQLSGVTERKPVYDEWLKLINDELPFLFLYAESDLAGVRTDRVRGVAPDARGALWNIWQWWIPAEQQ